MQSMQFYVNTNEALLHLKRSEPKKEIIVLRVEKSLRDQLLRYVEEKGLSQSEFIRGCLLREIV